LSGSARDLLEGRLALAVDGGDWERAAELLAAFMDCWPLAAAIEDAGARWRVDAHPSALAVIARAAEVVRLAQGWQAGPDGRWLLPDPGWIEEQGGDDGEPGAGDHRAVGLELVDADALPDERARLAAALARGELRAVLLQGAVPETPQAQLAVGELRLEGSHQRLVDRFGAVAAQVPMALTSEPSAWDHPDLLDAPSPGRGGQALVARCEGRYLPGPVSALRRGRPQRVGTLLWDAPVRPLMVAPVAVAVLQTLDGERDCAAVAAQLGGPQDQVQEILDELVAIGAASAD